MTVQIWMKGTKPWKASNDGATATSATMVFYNFTPEDQPRYINKQSMTPATASSTTASIVVRDTYNVFDDETPQVTA